MLTPNTAAHNADRDVIGQIKLAFSNPLPLIIGALIGGLVPLATYIVGHAELAGAGWASVPGLIVVGGCLFSAITVYKWGRRAFDSAFKALGFVILSEGVMTFSQTHWLCVVVLGFLIAINAVANGANLAVAHLDAEARRTAQVAQTVQDVVSAPAISAPAVTPASIATPAASAETALVPVTAKRRRPRSKTKAPRGAQRGALMLN